jgi:hypothetical protein
MAGVNEEGADLRRFGRGVQGRRIAPGSGIAAEQRRSKAPSAAADDLAAIFDHVVGLVGQQLAVDAERPAQRAFNLRGTVIGRAQTARGAGDQRIERRDVGRRGFAQGEGH